MQSNDLILIQSSFIQLMKENAIMKSHYFVWQFVHYTNSFFLALKFGDLRIFVLIRFLYDNRENPKALQSNF